MGRIGTDPDASLLKKLLLRLDGAANSRRVEFTSTAGNRWEAELSLHSGTNAQSPRLKILFRCKSSPDEPQRYNEAPSGVSKDPRKAVEELSEDDLRELLSESVKV